MAREEIPYAEATWRVGLSSSVAHCLVIALLAALAFALSAILAVPLQHIALIVVLSIISIILSKIYRAVARVHEVIRYADEVRIFNAVMQFIDRVDWENGRVPDGSVDTLRERTRDTAFVYGEIDARFVQEIISFALQVSDISNRLEEHGRVLRRLWLSKAAERESYVQTLEALKGGSRDEEELLDALDKIVRAEIRSDELKGVAQEADGIETVEALNSAVHRYKYSEWASWVKYSPNSTKDPDAAPNRMFADLVKGFPARWRPFLESGPADLAFDMFASRLQDPYTHFRTRFQRHRAYDQIVTEILYPDSHA